MTELMITRRLARSSLGLVLAAMLSMSACAQSDTSALGDLSSDAVSDAPSGDSLAALQDRVAEGAPVPASSVQLTAAQPQITDIDPTIDSASWREVPADDLIVFETSRGRILIETLAEFAPLHVARIEALVAQGFYNNTVFHRVIDGFVIQGGDPTGLGTGGSGQNISAEFITREPVAIAEVRDDRTLRAGFFKGAPVLTQKPSACFEIQNGLRAPSPVLNCSADTDYRPERWITHCPGVASMARAQDPNSADSQFFLVRGNASQLDRQYTGWGHVVAGVNHVYAVTEGTVGQTRGFKPDRLFSARMASQLPASERPRVFVAREGGAVFNSYLAANRNAFDVVAPVCELHIPRIIIEADGTRLLEIAPPKP
jgi:peptidylprolyl isomerase